MRELLECERLRCALRLTVPNFMHAHPPPENTLVRVGGEDKRGGYTIPAPLAGH